MEILKMKKLISITFFSLALSFSVFSQETVAKDTESQNTSNNEITFEVMNLIKSDFTSNYDSIVNLSKDLTQEQKEFIFSETKKNAVFPSLLNLVLPVGIGCWIQGDVLGGKIATIGMASSLTLAFTTVIVMFNLSNLNDEGKISNDQYDTYNTISHYFIGLSMLGVAGFHIFGIVRPIIYTVNYNKNLKDSLGMSGVKSAVLCPYINPLTNQYGIIAEIKF